MRFLPIKNKKNLKGHRVILRLDLNVVVKNGKIEDDFRIKKILPTIRFLKTKGAKIIIISHLTKGRSVSLRPMSKYLSSYFDIKFSTDITGKKTQKLADNLKNGEILLLENIRKEKGEERNDRKFARRLASLGDIFVNDAFSACHRKHASVVGLPKLLPFYAGPLLLEEVKNLSGLFMPKHPFLLILGGVKFQSKLGVLNRFLKTADHIFIGGALANNFFYAKGFDIENSVIDKSVSIKKYLNNPKIILPSDSVIKNKVIVDVGEESAKNLADIICNSKLILWSGPLGDYERGFSKATKIVAKAILKSKATSIIGGGDTVTIVHRFENLDKYSFVSTGGGAMLEFLSQGTLPGLKALEK